MKATNCIFALAVLIIVPALVVDFLMSHKKHYTAQVNPILQGKIKFGATETKLLDTETGKLIVEGWASTMPHDLEVNTEATKTLPFGN